MKKKKKNQPEISRMLLVVVSKGISYRLKEDKENVRCRVDDKNENKMIDTDIIQGKIEEMKVK